MTCTSSGPVPVVASLCIVFAFALVVFAGPPSGFNWTQTFDDEFNGTKLDTTKWHPHDYHCGTRNDEVQAYVPENVIVENGLCRIKGERRTVNYGYCGQPGNTKQYASGIIISQHKFTQRYGYFEARMKLPRGKNLWPAFWLHSGIGWPPEADILELVNGNDFAQYGYAMAWYKSSRYPSCSGSGSSGNYWNSWSGPKDLTTQFFNTAMLWTPDSCVFYVDERKIGKATENLQWNCPFFMMLNLAMKPGPTDAMLPACVDIDWVRVWQYSGTVKIAAPPHPNRNLSSTPIYANGTIRVDGTHEVQVTDLAGRLVLAHSGNSAWSTSIAGLAKGLYCLNVNLQSGVSYVTILSN